MSPDSDQKQSNKGNKLSVLKHLMNINLKFVGQEEEQTMSRKSLKCMNTEPIGVSPTAEEYIESFEEQSSPVCRIKNRYEPDR